ncbi:MAG: GAF domain-containing protein [Vicinamibacteria bacterium]
MPFEESTRPLDESSIAGHVALTGRVVNVADAYRLPEGSSFRISRSFDEKSGYRTKSMLVVPMRDHENAIIGVVQLINKKRDPKALLQPVALVEEEVVAFTSVDEDLAGSLASQAAVAFENANLLKEIKALFDKFVRAAAKAVEARDEVTSGHSERVAELTVAIAEKVDRLTTGPYAGPASRASSSRRSATRGSCTTSARSRSRRSYLGKRKKLYATRMVAVAALRLHPEVLRGGLPARAARRGDGGAAPDELAALETAFLAQARTEKRTRRRPRGERADGGGGGELQRPHEPPPALRGADPTARGRPVPRRERGPRSPTSARTRSRRCRSEEGR